MLDGLSIFGYNGLIDEVVTALMTIKSPDKPAAANVLGEYLASLRNAKGFTLRAVEEATQRAVSNAYLSQLENGKISKPSPQVLYSLSQAYAVAYDVLMDKAGYLGPRTENGGEMTSESKDSVLSIEGLTADEKQEVLRYVSYLRSKRKKSHRS